MIANSWSNIHPGYLDPFTFTPTNGRNGWLSKMAKKIHGISIIKIISHSRQPIWSINESCCNSFSKIVSFRWKLKTCRSERFYPIRLFLPVSIIIFVSTRKKRAKNCITLFTLQDLNDFSFYIFHFKFIFNYTERACRSTKGTVIIRWWNAY